jgi:hypothetical protein
VQMGSLWLSIEAFQDVPGLPQLTHSQDSAGIHSFIPTRLF